MRMGVIVGSVLVLLLGAPWLSSFSQQAAPPQASSTGTANPQVISTLLPSGIQQIVLVDDRQMTMATYHIEPATAKIRLMSVRNLRHDLNIMEFNASSPLPSEMGLLRP